MVPAPSQVTFWWETLTHQEANKTVQIQCYSDGNTQRHLTQNMGSRWASQGK